MAQLNPKKPRKTIDKYLGPCDECGGKLTIGSFIEQTEEGINIHLFAKCTECNWTEDPRKEKK